MVQETCSIGADNTKKITFLLGNTWNASSNLGAFDTYEPGELRNGWLMTLRQIKGDCKTKFSYINNPEHARFDLQIMQFLSGELIPITYSLALDVAGTVLSLRQSYVGTDENEAVGSAGGTLLQDSDKIIPEANKEKGRRFVDDLVRIIEGELTILSPNDPYVISYFQCLNFNDRQI